MNDDPAMELAISGVLSTISTKRLVKELESRDEIVLLTKAYTDDEFNWTMWDRTDDIQIDGGRIRGNARIIVVRV